MKESSIIRENLMNREGYSPYCGNPNCRIMPRTHFNGSQFVCHVCGWKSSFPEEFITRYKKRWNLK